MFLLTLVDGQQDWEKKRHRLFWGLSVAAAALVTSLPNSESSDPSEESKKEPSSVSSSQISAEIHTDSKDGKDSVEGQALSRHHKDFQSDKWKLKITKEGKYANKSNMYFVGLFWGILLSRLWLHWDFIMILLVPIMFYVLKKLLSCWSSSIYSSVPSVFLISQWGNVRSWANDRKQALIPAPLSRLVKGGIKVDRTVSLFKLTKLNTTLIKCCKYIVSVASYLPCGTFLYFNFHYKIHTKVEQNLLSFLTRECAHAQ